MPDEGKRDGMIGSDRQIYRLLPPLTVAFVCLLLIGLFLVMGWTDLRGLENAMINDVEAGARRTLETVEREAGRIYPQMLHAPAIISTGKPGFSFEEDTVPLFESLILDLTELALEVDAFEVSGRLSIEELGAFSEKEHLWLMCLLGEKGEILFCNRRIPPLVLEVAKPVLNGKKAIEIRFFHRFPSPEGIGIIAVRRRSDAGSIILGLDETGFRYRSMKLAVRNAVEEVAERTNLVYLRVVDSEGKTVTGYGEEVKRETDPWIHLMKGEEGAKPVRWKDERILHAQIATDLPGGIPGTAFLGLPLERVDRLLEKERLRIFVSVGFMALIASLSIWLLYRTQGRYWARMREMERKLSRAERLSALGRLAAGVAHEIRNPLNAINMAAQRLRGDSNSGIKEVIRDESRRLDRIVEDFLQAAGTRKLEFQPRDLNEVVRQTVDLMNEEASSRGIRIETSLSEKPFFVGLDRDRFKQALLNIVKNAMESISGKGAVYLGVVRKDQGKVAVEVSDTGRGMGPEEMEKIFDPDYTTKEKGLGLGLSLAYEIIRGHGGEIQVRSTPGSGTTFEIILPYDEGRSHSHLKI